MKRWRRDKIKMESEIDYRRLRVVDLVSVGEEGCC